MPSCAGTVAAVEDQQPRPGIPSSFGKDLHRSPSRATKPYLDTTDSDDAAIRQVQNGDGDGEGEGLVYLFNRYSRPVLSLAIRMLRNREDAQEILQEVFLYIHRRSELFDPARGSVGTWVLQQAYSRSINRWNQKRSGVSGGQVSMDTLRGLADSDSGQRRLVEKLSARQIVHPLLRELTPDQRETLLLFFFEGYTLREIDEIRKQGEKNSRHHYYRGIEKLRRILAEKSPPSTARRCGDEARSSGV